MNFLLAFYLANISSTSNLQNQNTECERLKALPELWGESSLFLFCSSPFRIHTEIFFSPTVLVPSCVSHPLICMSPHHSLYHNCSLLEERILLQVISVSPASPLTLQCFVLWVPCSERTKTWEGGGHLNFAPEVMCVAVGGCTWGWEPGTSSHLSFILSAADDSIGPLFPEGWIHPVRCTETPVKVKALLSLTNSLISELGN